MCSDEYCELRILSLEAKVRELELNIFNLTNSVYYLMNKTNSIFK